MPELLSGGVERSYLRDLNGIATQLGDTISVRYTGKLSNGTVFDSNADGIKPEFSFQLGAGRVIKGWDTGLLGVNVGDVVILSIPADQAYGANATGSIPANSPLNFQVEVLGRSNATASERLSALQFGVPNTVLQAYLATANSQEADLKGLDAADQLTIGPKGGAVLAAAGNDSLTGGLGNDLLAGGLGADIFVLSVGNDVISDFSITEGDIIIGRASLQRSLVDTVSGLSINYSDGSSTLLAGISSTGFDAKKAFLDLSDISIIPIKSGGISPESAQDRKKSISHDYLASYADLTTVIGNNLELASKHFYLFGFQEGRSIDRFNNAAYLEANPGVANSAYFRDRSSEHFIIYGSKEGRAATIY
ncbi:FKBP-type peptidyl-prolyl cis-trans isomerase [Synechococcus sp. Cruz CV12-2-Slac-r]|uniref:FKBP-type peptidyl-prolyl cis-trans isomerase n=1 Tax=Synechococcus sp. Cruz CV12-2-Slac-r TaxID=2823748 RepID=UPI0020CF9483|nr:FKBP-type peptidyl-prolyl cis-trans isomerase [Synechococcus sp. Cruz CV12-2-Slac-r]MCP9939776.1 FKBP-type peptidyl-prolyl cis-trans isomerase [Synechococcus sp. Cruz CV12-2-Slac-r]